jgi:hypothetical protein
MQTGFGQHCDDYAASAGADGRNCRSRRATLCRLKQSRAATPIRREQKLRFRRRAIVTW